MKGHLLHVVPDNYWGGAQRYAYDICRHYRASGVKVTAMTRGAMTIDRHFTEADIPVLNAPLRGPLDTYSLHELTEWMRRLPQGEPVTVHTHRYRDAGLAVIARHLAKRPEIRIVTTRHVVGIGRDSLLFRHLYKRIDTHLFVSNVALNRFKDTWVNRHLPLDPAKLLLLPYSLNTPITEPVAEPDRGPFVIMFHGHITEGKGLETLIDSLSQLRGRKVRLRIAGRGNPDAVDILRRRAMTAGVMDMIDWQLNHPDTGALLAGCHVGVLPTDSREGFGIANLEYMAIGRPQICSATRAQLDYGIPQQTALVVPPLNAPALTEVITYLIDNPEERQRLGKAAYDYFHAHLAWEQFIDKLNPIYDFSE